MSIDENVYKWSCEDKDKKFVLFVDYLNVTDKLINFEFHYSFLLKPSKVILETNSTLLFSVLRHVNFVVVEIEGRMSLLKYTNITKYSDNDVLQITLHISEVRQMTNYDLVNMGLDNAKKGF